MPLLLLLALAAFSSSLSVRILDPIVPELARDLGTQVTTVALLASAFAFPCALGQPILGPLGDAFGKARMIKVCLALLTVGGIAATLAPNIEFLFAARILSGFASGGIIPMCFATVGDRFEIQDRQVALSRILSAILTGQLSGAIGAGLIASETSWRVVILLTAVTSLIALGLAWRGLRPQGGAKRAGFTFETMLANYGRVFANPGAVVCYGAVFIEGMAIFGILPYLAAMLEENHTGSIREAGFIISGMAAGGILYTFAVKLLLRRITYLTMIRLGGLVTATGFGVLAAFLTWPPKAAAFVLIGFGFYMIHNSIQTQVTELAPEARGAAMGLHAFSYFLGQAMGPVLYGFGLKNAGQVETIGVAAIVMLLLGLATAEGFKRRSQSSA
ncbi:MAG: MFS transporter [Hyphomicrobiaceae bacterium]